jgi:hypothetical protein
VDSVHESGVVAHLWRHRPEEMADPLLVLHVHVKVVEHDGAAVRTNALSAALCPLDFITVIRTAASVIPSVLTGDRCRT